MELPPASATKAIGVTGEQGSCPWGRLPRCHTLHLPYTITSAAMAGTSLRP